MIKFININKGLSDKNIEWISISRLAEDSIKLIQYVEPNTIGIIGVPRSGMIPASIVATHTNLPLFNISKSRGIVYTGGGFRENYLKYNDIYGHYLLVDDSVCSGNQIIEIKKMIELLNRNNIKKGLPEIEVRYSVVYASSPDFVDYYSVVHNKIHIFEWNIFNNFCIEGITPIKCLSGGCCLDWDGILNSDCDFKHTSNNEEDVVNWIKTVKPHRWLPRLSKVPAIISFRLEKHRRYCLDWLEKWGIECNLLKLHPANTFEERDRNFDVAGYKGKFFKDSDYSLFFESCPVQSQIIANVACKPVCCPTNGKFYYKED